MKHTKRRLLYLIGFILLFITEVLIALYIHDKIVRPYIGDILVVMLIYCFLRIFKPQGLKFLPLGIFIFAFFVEIFQLINIVKILGLQSYPLARTIIGTSFSMVDIFCYLIGCILITIWDIKKVNTYD